MFIDFSAVGSPPRKVAQWMYDYLGANVTIEQVIADAQSAGAGHSPRGPWTRISLADMLG